MLCPNCGSELSEDAPFCLTCSSFVEVDQATTPSSSPASDDPIALLLRQGRHQEALTQCQQALLAAPEDGTRYAQLGDCYRALGQSVAAMDAYKKALRYQTTDPETVRRHLDAVIDQARAQGVPATPAHGVELRGGTSYVAPPPPEATPAQRRLRLGLLIAGCVIALVLISTSVYLALHPTGTLVPQPRHAVPLPLGHEVAPDGGAGFTR